MEFAGKKSDRIFCKQSLYKGRREHKRRLTIPNAIERFGFLLNFFNNLAGFPVEFNDSVIAIIQLQKQRPKLPLSKAGFDGVAALFDPVVP